MKVTKAQLKTIIAEILNERSRINFGDSKSANDLEKLVKAGPTISISQTRGTPRHKRYTIKSGLLINSANEMHVVIPIEQASKMNDAELESLQTELSEKYLKNIEAALERFLGYITTLNKQVLINMNKQNIQWKILGILKKRYVFEFEPVGHRGISLSGNAPGKRGSYFSVKDEKTGIVSGAKGPWRRGDDMEKHKHHKDVIHITETNPTEITNTVYHEFAHSLQGWLQDGPGSHAVNFKLANDVDVKHNLLMYMLKVLKIDPSLISRMNKSTFVDRNYIVHTLAGNTQSVFAADIPEEKRISITVRDMLSDTTGGDNLRHMFSHDHVGLSARALYRHVDKIIKGFNDSAYIEEFTKLLTFKYPPETYEDSDVLRIVTGLKPDAASVKHNVREFLRFKLYVRSDSDKTMSSVV